MRDLNISLVSSQETTNGWMLKLYLQK